MAIYSESLVDAVEEIEKMFPLTISLSAKFAALRESVKALEGRCANLEADLQEAVDERDRKDLELQEAIGEMSGLVLEVERLKEKSTNDERN